MTLPARWASRLRIPAIGAPMFLASGVDLVVAQCESGILGTFASLNARSTAAYKDWLDAIALRLSASAAAAPFGVNLIVHRSNTRLDADLAATVEARVPLVITSLGAVREVVAAVHAYGGLVFHDVVNRRHAEKAADAGVDGLVGVSAGAGGHAGSLHPFALLTELRSVFAGPIALAGCIGSGREIAAAIVAGADLAYLGTRFIATRESLAAQGHKDMILAARAEDIAYTASVSGIPANFLVPSLRAAGIDPTGTKPAHKLDLAADAKAWRDIWSAGQGVGAIQDIPSARDLCARLTREYDDALAAVARRNAATGR
jgi:nitronate monooxygenase